MTEGTRTPLPAITAAAISAFVATLCPTQATDTLLLTPDQPLLTAPAFTTWTGQHQRIRPTAAPQPPVLSVADQQWEQVISAELLPQATAALPLLRELRRICRPGGRIVLLEPLAPEDLPQAIAYTTVRRLAESHYVGGYAASELAAMIKAGGLKVHRVEQIAIPLAVTAWLALAQTPPAQQARVHELLTANSAHDQTGLAPHWHGQECWVTFRLAGILTEVPAC